MAFIYHTDPGHGWLEVSFTELHKVGLTPSDFSAFSYQKDRVVYLEEDCDAAIFLRAYEAMHGKRAEIVERFLNAEHWIRQLDDIEPSVLDDEIPW